MNLRVPAAPVAGATAVVTVTVAFAVAPLAFAQVGPAVTVDDVDQLLQPAEVERLNAETAEQGDFGSIEEVTYLVFAENDDNLNDTVEEYIRGQHPDMIAPDDEHWADGNLIVAVGHDPQRVGVYCGENVCEEFNLRDSKHLDVTLNSAKDYLRDGEIASGMLASVNHAVDPAAIAADQAAGEREDTVTAWVIGGIVGAGALLMGGGVWAARRKKRKARIDEARSDYAYVMEHYADTAHRLDAIDIRAHSLTSPLANAKMRAEWADVRDRFLDLDSTVQSFRGLESNSDDATFHEHYDELNTAEETTLQVITAEENIETMYNAEHGDAGARLTILDDVKKDLVEAETTVTSDSLRERVTESIKQVDELRLDLQAEDFLDRFVIVLSDVAIVLAAIDQQEFSDVDRETQREVPRIYDRNYRVGTGVNNYVPFFMLSSWHDSDVAAHQAAQEQANTSYSSGFSGGGGSSAW